MQFSRSQAAPLAVPRSPLGASRRDVSQRDVLDRYWIGSGLRYAASSAGIERGFSHDRYSVIHPAEIRSPLGTMADIRAAPRQRRTAIARIPHCNEVN